MAETQTKSTKGQDVEKVQEKRKRAEPTLEHIKALDGESIPFPGLLGDSAMGLPIERHAALLGDPRFSYLANNAQKARLVTELQQNYGNTYVQRVVGLIQAKKDGALLQEEPGLASIERRIAEEKGSGQPLEPKTLSEMEAAFSQDFGDVRIHTNSEADKLSQELGARAFTSGKDIFFREGAYQPNSEAGKDLVAHELTHVIQQCRTPKIGEGLISQEGDASEMEARASELRVVTGRQATIEQSFEQQAIQRQVLPTVGNPVTTVTFPEEEAEAIGGSLEPRKKFLASIKIAIWPEPRDGNIKWLTDDPMNVFLTPYSDEANPGIGFSTLFLVLPSEYIDRPGPSPPGEWPRNGKLGCKYDFFLKGAAKGAHDFDLSITLRFEGLDPKERPSVIRKLHIIDMRPSRTPELPAVKKVGEQRILEKKYKVDPALNLLFVPSAMQGRAIEPEDVDQRYVGTCYFLASLAAVAKDHPEVIRNMIKDNGDGTFTVTFYESTGPFLKRGSGYRPVQVTVDWALPMYRGAGGGPHWKSLAAEPAELKVPVFVPGPIVPPQIVVKELWVAIAEKAYAKWKGGYPEVGKGGEPKEALPEITGMEAKDFSTDAFSNKGLLELISKALTLKHPVTASAYPSRVEKGVELWLPGLAGKMKEMRGKLDVYYSHAYTVLEVNGDKIRLRNPWGFPGFCDFELRVDYFKYYFKTFTISRL